MLSVPHIVFLFCCLKSPKSIINFNCLVAEFYFTSGFRLLWVSNQSIVLPPAKQQAWNVETHLPSSRISQRDRRRCWSAGGPIPKAPGWASGFRVLGEMKQRALPAGGSGSARGLALGLLYPSSLFHLQYVTVTV